MAGELSRLVRRAFSAERSRELLQEPPRKVGPGGLVVPFSPDLAALCVSYHRTSARVLWDLAESYSSRLEPLYEDFRELFERDERRFWQTARTLSVVAFGTRSVEAGERQVVGVIKNALFEAAARRGIELRVDPDNPDLLLHARSLPDEQGELRLVVSLDLAGRPMHQRGYRTRAGEAPLREDLAANLVMLARHDPRQERLIDPLAGSGTLVIEAALMAAGRPVWMSGRRPAAANLEEFDPHFRTPPAPLFADSKPRFFAAEIDEDSYDAMDRALLTAGTSAQTTTFLGDFRDWDLARELRDEPPGLILCNPPYGARMGGSLADLKRLYRDLGTWCRDFRGYRAGFIVGEPEPDRELRKGPSIVHTFQEQFGFVARVKKPISNGPLRAQFLLYDL